MVRVEAGFPIYAVPRVWQWVQAFKDRVADDYGPKTIEEFIEHWERAERAGRKSWQVIRDEELGGVILASRISPILSEAHAVFKKSFWGRATTLVAMRMVFEEMFADPQLLKICSYVFRDNGEMIALGKSLGAQIEGILKGHTMRGGKPVDMAVLSLSREKFNAVHDGVGKRPDRQHPGKSVLGFVDKHKPEHQRQQQLIDQWDQHDGAKPKPGPVLVNEQPAVVRVDGDAKPIVDHSAVSAGGAG